VQWFFNTYPHIQYIVDESNAQACNLWLTCRYLLWMKKYCRILNKQGMWIIMF